MKLLTIISICLLILLTALVKNSTKKLEDEIFVKQENLRSLNKEFQNTKLEYDYLSSSTILMEFQKNYFEDQLIFFHFACHELEYQDFFLWYQLQNMVHL